MTGPAHDGNLGSRGRRIRLALGLISLAGAGVLGLSLASGTTGAMWRLTLFAMYWLGAIGVLQAQTHT